MYGDPNQGTPYFGQPQTNALGAPMGGNSFAGMPMAGTPPPQQVGMPLGIGAQPRGQVPTPLSPSIDQGRNMITQSLMQNPMPNPMPQTMPPPSGPQMQMPTY